MRAAARAVLVLWIALSGQTASASAAAWKAGERVPAGSLIERPATVSVFLRHDRPGPEADLALAELGRTRFPDVMLVKEAGVRGPAAAGPLGSGVSLPPKKQPLPSDDVLAYTARRLTPEERERLKRTTSVLVLTFLVDPARRADLASVCALAHALAQRTGGFLEDGDTRDVFTADQWKAARLDSWQGAIPAVSGHISIRPWKDAQAGGIDTVGMGRFGLPELSVAGLTERDAPAAAAAVTYAAQQRVERPGLDRAGELTVRATALLHARVRARPAAGAPGASVIEVRAGKPAFGGARRTMVLTPSPRDGSAPALIARVIRELSGQENEEALSPEADRDLTAASARAQVRLAELKRLYRTRPPADAQLMVKAAFATASGGREWMWVQVERWEGDRITGSLLNAPSEVPDLAEGQSVTVADKELFDYRFEVKGKPPEGAETDRIMEHRSPKNEE